MTHITYTRRSILAAAIVSLTALGAAVTTQAATITWGAAQNITADTDVSTSGTLVDAFNLGGDGGVAANTTINGVTFQALNIPIGQLTYTSGNYTFTPSFGPLGSGIVGSASAPFTGLSAAYQSLLNTEAGGFGPVTLTLDIAGLTVGQSYEFQFWANRSNTTGNSGALFANAGNQVILDVNTTNAEGGLGQFAIGTFIADNAIQQITFQHQFSTTFINGFQLRTAAGGPGTAVPEPGSALVGMLALGLCGARLGRRQRAAQS